jgi:uncharacterized protein (TIGR00730 family)
VYCGSSTGRRPAYREAARGLATLCGQRGIRLVYGGGRIGLMGELADAALAAGAAVTGVIPRALAEQELAHEGVTELIVTESMHARKQIMAERSDAFVALPGGIGTLDELFEVWTWTQLGFQGKPCGLLNVEGYFDGLLRFLEHAVGEGFLQGVHRRIASVATEPEALLAALEGYQPQPRAKWLPSSST